MCVCVCQSELVFPVETALDYYTKLQEDMEMEKHTDDDVQTQLEQLQQLPIGSITGKQHVTDKTSSMDALGFATDYKFKVQKIVARPAVK